MRPTERAPRSTVSIFGPRCRAPPPETRKTGRPPGLPEHRRLPAPNEQSLSRKCSRAADGRLAPARSPARALTLLEGCRERRPLPALAMALQANSTELRDRARERLGGEAFDSYLAELEITELSAGRVVLSVGATLAREASRRCGPALTVACRELFGSRQVLLAGDGEWFDLGEGNALGPAPEPRTHPKPHASSGSGRVRQRLGPCGQPGTRERLASQKAFRVPFALAASLPRCASQAFGRHSPQQPLEYVGRWGKAHSEETLTPFHQRLLLGTLRLAQAGCVTDEGVACSINTAKTCSRRS